MPPTIRTIIGTITHQDGTPWSGATISAKLNGGYTSTDQFPSDTTAAIADSSGDFELLLWANGEGTAASTYAFLINGTDRFTAVVPATGSGDIQFSTLRLAATPPDGWDDTVQALLDLYELDLGVPAVTGYVLSSTTAGVRSWVAQSGAGGSDANYRHVQSSAASIWTVTHNLGKRTAVSIVDSAGDEVYGAVHYNSDNQVTLTFSASFAGEAYFN